MFSIPCVILNALYTTIWAYLGIQITPYKIGINYGCQEKDQCKKSLDQEKNNN